MVPRISAQLPIRLLHDFHARPAVSFTELVSAQRRAFSFTANEQAPARGGQAKKKTRRYKDAYTQRQAEARRTANLSRQAVLKKERTEEAGDPLRGKVTPFVESFDIANGQTLSPPQVAGPDASARSTKQSNSDVSKTEGKAGEDPSTTKFQSNHLNFNLSASELENALDYSYHLSRPYLATGNDPSKVADQDLAFRQHDADYVNAAEAIQRIVSLDHANSKERTRINIQRCIDEFGRHKTDATVKPRAPSAQTLAEGGAFGQGKERAGPDTGSSEVQIAILTAKIRAVANEYQATGRTDKVNKRNLRLLLHRRQKLLKYFHRQDRGGGRCTHLTETLGLTDATWKGEIEVR